MGFGAKFDVALGVNGKQKAPREPHRNAATTIGGGSGGGLIIGAIAGGARGALIGGPIGAGAGTAAAYFAGKRDVKLPVETYLNFKLTEPLTVDSRS